MNIEERLNYLYPEGFEGKEDAITANKRYQDILFKLTEIGLNVIGFQSSLLRSPNSNYLEPKSTFYVQAGDFFEIIPKIKNALNFSTFNVSLGNHKENFLTYQVREIFSIDESDFDLGEWVKDRNKFFEDNRPQYYSEPRVISTNDLTFADIIPNVKENSTRFYISAYSEDIRKENKQSLLAEISTPFGKNEILEGKIVERYIQLFTL